MKRGQTWLRAAVASVFFVFAVAAGLASWCIPPAHDRLREATGTVQQVDHFPRSTTTRSIEHWKVHAAIGGLDREFSCDIPSCVILERRLPPGTQARFSFYDLLGDDQLYAVEASGTPLLTYEQSVEARRPTSTVWSILSLVAGIVACALLALRRR